ncbi:hypothetical protein HZA43_04015 [Candidatus Peregrinibacteria bacterium]|nr:hypothetical protein [Candidatus Peregrinibacteria bacterium]
MKKSLLLLCAVFGIWTAVLPAQAQEAPFFSETTQKLFTVSGEFLPATLVDFSVSRDGKSVAYSLLQGNKEWVVFNGKPGKQYDNVSLLTVSPDGKSVFYAAKNDNSDNEILVMNGREERRAGRIITADNETIPFFKNEPVYYTYSEARDTVALYIGAKKIIGGQFPFFDKNFTKMGYLLQTRLKDGTAIQSLVDDENGRKGKVYEMIYGTQFNDDGTISYLAKAKNGFFLVRDNREILSYPALPDENLDYWSAKISPDGKNMIFDMDIHKKTVTEESVHVNPWDFDSYHYVGKRKSERRDAMVGATNLMLFSPDSKRTAYTVYRNGVRVAVDGKEGPTAFSDMENITFSPDSKHVAYIGMKSYAVNVSENKLRFTYFRPRSLILDGKEIKTYGFDDVGDGGYVGGYLEFTPKGNGLVYTTYNNMTLEQKFVVEGKELKDYYTSDPQSTISPFIFNEDGTKVGIFAMKTNPDTSLEEGWWIVEDLEQ